MHAQPSEALALAAACMLSAILWNEYGLPLPFGMPVVHGLVIDVCWYLLPNAIVLSRALSMIGR